MCVSADPAAEWGDQGRHPWDRQPHATGGHEGNHLQPGHRCLLLRRCAVGDGHPGVGGWTAVVLILCTHQCGVIRMCGCWLFACDAAVRPNSPVLRCPRLLPSCGAVIHSAPVLVLDCCSPWPVSGRVETGVRSRRVNILHRSCLAHAALLPWSTSEVMIITIGY